MTPTEEAVAALCKIDAVLDLFGADEASLNRLARACQIENDGALTDAANSGRAALARLTAEQPPIPPDRERLAQELIADAEWIEQGIPDGGATPISKRIRDAAALLRTPADGWRAGAEARVITMDPIHVKIDVAHLIDLTEDFENHDQPEGYEALCDAIWKAHELLPKKSEIGPSVQIILTVVNEPYTGD